MEVVSFEFLLRYFANGGSIIILRAVCTAAALWLIALGGRNLLDPNRTWEFNTHEFRLQLIETFQWFGTFFAGVYVALYTRYSSQWSYLAGVYNQIKAAECKRVDEKEALADWKAGFIEDAVALHLAKKPTFAAIIRVWAQDLQVRKSFENHAPTEHRGGFRLPEPEGPSRSE